MRAKVYVARLLPKEAMDRMRTSCDVEVWEGDLPPPRELLLERIRDVEGLVCLLTDRIDAEVLNNARKLKVISNYAVGYNNIDIQLATKRGIVVGNTPEVLTETTADFAFALMMAAARRVVEGDRIVRAGGWETWGPMILRGVDVHGATLGIIGLGRIGSAVARRARGFEMKTLYTDPTRRLDFESELGLQYVEFDVLLEQSDFITVHVNLTPETHHLIGKREFEKMKHTCILVNTSRGEVVDNLALYDALRNGRIAYAALDVTDPEPIPTSHQLLMLENVIITPHIASATVTTRTRMALMAAENLIAGLNGDLPPHCVNPEALKMR